MFVRCETLNIRKYFSPTPASKFCLICGCVSARLKIATRRTTPVQVFVPDTSLPRTNANVSSHSFSVPPGAGSCDRLELAVHIDLAARDRIERDDYVLQRGL